MRQLGQEAVVMARLWAAARPVSVRDMVEDLRPIYSPIPPS